MPRCFDTGLYSDLRIKDSNGHEYAVHRIIVCGQSTVLAKACKPEHGFKVSLTSAPRFSIVHLLTFGIREIVSSVIVKHYEELLSMAEFEAVLDDFGTIGKDVLRAFAKAKVETPKRLKYKCRGSNNNTHFVQMALDLNVPDQFTRCPSCGVGRRNKNWASMICSSPEEE